MSSSPLLEMRLIRKAFPGVLALDDVNLVAHAGEIHALVGENGAGKSTLMKVLSGAYPDHGGEILIQGEKISIPNPRAAEQAGIATIYQELNLVPDLSVAENIFLGREPVTRWRTLDRRRMERDAKALLGQLNCVVNPWRRLCELRLGEQQLVEVAKALSLDARILIMDEPTSALSDQEAHRLFQVIRAMKAEGMTVLYISHKMDEVFALADRITVLRDGRVVGTKRREDTVPEQIITMMVGRQIEEMFPVQSRQCKETVLRVEDLSTAHPTRVGERFLDRVSFQLRQGEVVGIAGLMGSGRSELLEALFGSPRTPLLGGQILVDEQVRAIRKPMDAIKSGLALVTEDRKGTGLFLQMTVGQNITIASLTKLARLGWIPGQAEIRVGKTYVEKLSIRTPGLHTSVENLSGGNQQKTIIARWLLTEPRVLLLDDPTRGIDVGAKAELYRLMDALAGQGIGILMASSELPELLALCDRILVLCEGRLTGQLTRDEATEERIMALATIRHSAHVGLSSVETAGN
ncbi:MAG TPA: sugar ABC transporter ATP-binding protein [bacterium]|nr:sugar ABC transporter ATP-binding protein [bacterium]